MDDINPYQSPETSPLDAPAEHADGRPWVDGGCLVVASGTVLPPVCVKTNERVSENDLMRKDYHWCSPLVGLLVLASGLLLILVYFAARKKCSVTFGLHPRVRWKYRRRVLLKVVATIVLFLAIPYSATVDDTALPFLVMVLFLAVIVSFFIGNSPLSVVKYRKGMFWVEGFSREFLADFKPESVMGSG
jgi:hypothetical protein